MTTATDRTRDQACGSWDKATAKRRWTRSLRRQSLRGLGDSRWIRSSAYRRRREPTRPEQHHLPAEQPRSIAGSESKGDRRWRTLTEKSPVPSA